VRGGHVDDRLTGELRRERRFGGRYPEPERRHQLVRGGRRPLADAGRHLVRTIGGEQQHALRHRLTELVQAELERRDDAEVRTGAAHAPEQVGVLLLARADLLAVGRHEVDREHVVDRVAPMPLEPPQPATQGQPRDARVTDHPHRTREPVDLRRRVEVAQEAPAGHARRARFQIDPHAFHQREVDHDPVVARGEAADAVTTAPDGDDHLLVSCESDRGGHVLDRGAPRDERGSPVDHPVPHEPRGLVVRAPGRHDLALEGSAEGRERRGVHRVRADQGWL
jgi:hypothetical protein